MLIKNDNEACKSCMYFDKSENMVVGVRTGTCRYGPPTGAAIATGPGQIAPIGVWPQVSEDDWCGRYGWDEED